MAILNPSNPERFTPLAYPSDAHPAYVDKLFDDPDFIRLHFEDKKKFSIRWASGASVTQSVGLLDEIIFQSDFTSGTIALRHAPRAERSDSGGVSQLNGEAEDILNEVLSAGDRVIGYSLSSNDLELRFHPSWPKTYHDIETNEVVLRMKRTNKMARFITDQAISLTAMHGLRSSIDQTLDEFGVYLRALRS